MLCHTKDQPYGKTLAWAPECSTEISLIGFTVLGLCEMIIFNIVSPKLIHTLNRKRVAPVSFTIRSHRKHVMRKNVVCSFSKIVHPNKILIYYSWLKLTSFLNSMVIEKFPLLWIGVKEWVSDVLFNDPATRRVMKVN